MSFNQQSKIQNPKSSQWLEVCVMTEPETAEAVSEVMSRYAPNGVAIEQIARDIRLGADEGAAAQLEPLVAVPPSPLTVIGPDEAPTGTVAVIWLDAVMV